MTKLEDLKTLGIKTLIIELTTMAYREGAEHAFEDAFPDVGALFGHKFNDTECYKQLKELEIL